MAVWWCINQWVIPIQRTWPWHIFVFQAGCLADATEHQATLSKCLPTCWVNGGDHSIMCLKIKHIPNHQPVDNYLMYHKYICMYMYIYRDMYLLLYNKHVCMYIYITGTIYHNISYIYIYYLHHIGLLSISNAQDLHTSADLAVMWYPTTLTPNSWP